jgi:hypothetical protein
MGRKLNRFFYKTAEAEAKLERSAAGDRMGNVQDIGYPSADRQAAPLFYTLYCFINTPDVAN